MTALKSDPGLFLDKEDDPNTFPEPFRSWLKYMDELPGMFGWERKAPKMVAHAYHEIPAEQNPEYHRARYKFHHKDPNLDLQIQMFTSPETKISDILIRSFNNWDWGNGSSYIPSLVCFRSTGDIAVCRQQEDDNFLYKVHDFIATTKPFSKDSRDRCTRVGDIFLEETQLGDPSSMFHQLLDGAEWVARLYTDHTSDDQNGSFCKAIVGGLQKKFKFANITRQ